MSSRDRESTKKKILQSVSDILHEGSEDIGINRIAERAGVDKVLIYRYFGGLPGLLSTFAQDHQTWPEFEEVMETAPYVAAMLPPGEFSARFVQGFIRELLRRPATLEILRQELASPNDLTRETAAVRERRLAELLECCADDTQDTAALYALVAAGLLHLMLHSRASGHFCAIPLHTSAGWERIERAATRILQAASTDAPTALDSPGRGT